MTAFAYSALMPQAENAAHPFRFFGWVLLLSAPFYIWGVFWPVRGLPFGLPATVVMVVAPAIVATALTRREQGAEGARELWRRIGDVGSIPSASWFLTALVFMPAASLFGYFMMRLFDLSLPAAVSVSLTQAPVLFAVYFFGAIFEEIGWTGYATGPLQEQYGILSAGLMIGAVWALWHVTPWWLGQGHALSWVTWQALATTSMRIVMGWIYAYGGRSLLLSIVFHAMINVSYSLFPNEGSHYDPFILAAVLAITIGIIALTHALVWRAASWKNW